MTRTRLFVYGTLQRGERLNGWLVQGGAEFVGAARTEPKWHLLDLWGSFPAMSPGGATAVSGELWDVDDATLATLDRIEAAYERGVVAIDMGGGSVAWASAYVLRKVPEHVSLRGTSIIESGDWRAHRDAQLGSGQ